MSVVFGIFCYGAVNEINQNPLLFIIRQIVFWISVKKTSHLISPDGSMKCASWNWRKTDVNCVL